MALNYVSRGESVKASTVNSIIDAVAGGGNQSPDLIVTGTRSGPQFVAPAQLGSTAFDRYELFDVENQVLSAWPMAKLKLGFNLGDCTGGVAIHGDSGVKTAVSAVVVHKNTSTCPVDGGQLTAEVLTEQDFQQNTAAGNSGWVKTKLEGVHPNSGKIKLELWKTDGNYYQVFTNADQEDTRRGLSSVLEEKNVDQQELSGLEYFCGWTLAYQTKLSASGGGQVPTSRLIVSRGAKDAYEILGRDMKAVLKARLVCYKVEKENDETSTSWTWVVPLGPQAEYDDEAEAAYSPQLTYGGNPILVDSQEGQLDDGFDGQATWLTGQAELSNCLAFGSFEADGQTSCDAGELWLNLSYEYQKYAVVGTFGQGEDSSGESGGEGGEGPGALLSKKILIASAAGFQQPENPVAMQEAPAEAILHGTAGDMFKDGPKLDSYTPVDADVYTKSLNWARRQKPGEDGETAVDCDCLQLYDFDRAAASNPQTSSDLYLARRYDNETSCAELVYIPLSAYETIPDSMLSDA